MTRPLPHWHVHVDGTLVDTVRARTYPGAVRAARRTYPSGTLMVVPTTSGHQPSQRQFRRAFLYGEYTHKYGGQS